MCQKLPTLAFFAILWPLTGSKTLQKHFYLVEEVPNFDLVGHMWKSVKIWLQEWVLKIYKWKWGRSRWIAYFENYLQKQLGDRYGECPIAFPTKFPTEFPIAFPTRFSRNNFPQHFLQDFPTRFSHKIFLQDFPTRFSCKNFLQDFPARFSWARSWLVGSPSPYCKC